MLRGIDITTSTCCKQFGSARVLQYWVHDENFSVWSMKYLENNHWPCKTISFSEFFSGNHTNIWQRTHALAEFITFTQALSHYVQAPFPRRHLCRSLHEHGIHNFQEKKKKYEPPAPPTRIGKKQKKRADAGGLGSRLPTVTPTAKCKLRLLKLERVKDYLLMEQEFVQVRGCSWCSLGICLMHV